MRPLVIVPLAAMMTVTTAGVSSSTQSPQGQAAPASPPATGGTRSGGIPVPTIGTDRWAPGGFWRWRNIGIRELPN